MRMLAISAAIAAAWTCSAHAQVYTAGGLPISILDTPTVTSTLSISGGPATLSSLSLVLRINHTYNGDLDIALIRNGKYLHLSSDNGGNANNIANLRFSDSALLSVTTITGPDVTGVYRPEGGSLSVSGSATIPLTGLTPVADFAALINGEGADGDWTLWIDDDASGDVGSLVYWSLEFNGELDPTGPEEAPPPPAFSGAFTGTPNELLPEQPTSGTTLWTGPNGAQPGLTRGAGEPGLGTAYLGLFGNFTGNEVAYRYQHTGGSVTLVLDTFLSTMEIAVIDESGTPAGCFAGSGDSISFGTKTLTLQDLAAGTYYVVVDSAGSSPGAAYTLTAGAPPANDTCETAEPVLAGGLYAFDTTFASLTVPSPTGCGFTLFSPDIWYVYTAPANGVATFSACDADFETVLSAHSVCGGQDFACRGSGSCGGDGASLEVCVTQGQPLLVRLAGAFDVRGTGTLSVAFTSEEASSYAEQPGVAESETCRPMKRTATSSMAGATSRQPHSRRSSPGRRSSATRRTAPTPAPATKTGTSSRWPTPRRSRSSVRRSSARASSSSRTSTSATGRRSSRRRRARSPAGRASKCPPSSRRARTRSPSCTAKTPTPAAAEPTTTGSRGRTVLASGAPRARRTSTATTV